MSKLIEIGIGLNKSPAQADGRALRAELNKLNKDILSDAEKARAEDAAGFKKAEKEKVEVFRDSTGKLRDAQGKFVEDSKGGFEALGGTIEKAGKSVVGLAASLVGIQSAGQVVSMVVDHFKAFNTTVYEAGKFVEGYRKALQELAALKGLFGETTTAIKEDVAFRAKTLQSADDARQFQLAALGVGESAIDKPGRPSKITKDEFRKAMELTGSFQSLEGGSAETHGTLTGLIPLLGQGRTTGEDVARDEAQLFKIFQPGGASFTSLAGQYSRIAPLVSSKSLDRMQAAALLSMFSTTNREGAGTEVEQFTRATLGGINKTGKPRVEDGTPLGEYYKELGIDDKFLKSTKPENLALSIADKIARDVARQEEAATARGEEFSQATYLKGKGYANMEDLLALQHYIGFQREGTVGQFMALAEPGARPSLKEAVEPVAAAQRTEPVLQARKAELAEEAARIAIGAGKEEWLTNLQRVAFSRLKAQGEVAGEYSAEMQNSFSFNPSTRQSQNKVNRESQRILFEEARRLGIEAPNPAAMPAGGYQGVDGGYMYDLARRIQARGGTAVPGLDPLLGSAQASLNEANRFQGNPVAQETLRTLQSIDAKLSLPSTPPANVTPDVQRR